MANRKFRGIAPLPPSYLLTEVTIDGARWALYTILRADAPEDDNWQNLKLISLARRPKANYWIGWHIGDERLSGVMDARKLREHLPNVLAWLELYMREPETAALLYGS
jgi:hypothetical protein